MSLSIIIVNYNTSHFVKECVSSIKFKECEIIIVDNSVCAEERSKLSEISDSRVTTIFNPENLGFAKATNQGIRSSRGEYLFFLNPDTLVLDGAIERIIEHIRTHKDTGAVGVRSWLDQKKTLQFPQSMFPSLFLDIWYSLANMKLFRRSISLAAAKENYIFWTSENPLPVKTLPGAAILTTRKIIERVGHFDERFPLYYEDSDWCRRVRTTGYMLAVVPKAEIVHFYNQSAQTCGSDKKNKAYFSREVYMKKYYSLLFRKTADVFCSLIHNISSPCSDPVLHLGNTNYPSVFSIENDMGNQVLFEFSPNEIFLPAAGMVFSKPHYAFSDEIWGYLEQGTYFARFVDIGSWDILKTWSFIKEKQCAFHR